MDAKITKQRIGRMLSYDWLKIVGIILAVIIGWSLIFTMTATRILPSQEITIFSYYCNDTLPRTYYDREDALVERKVFSHQVLEVNTYDLAVQKDMQGMMLNTRLSTNEGDVIFVPHVANLDNAIQVGEEVKYPLTYVETLFASRPFQFFEVEKYLDGVSTWLDGWYIGGHETNAINEEKIKTEFIARVTQDKDKRYKTDKQKQAGALAEVERVKKYKEAYDTVEQAIADGFVRLEYIQTRNKDGSLWTYDETSETAVREGMYALNLCPNPEFLGTDATAKLRDWYQYEEPKAEEETSSSNKEDEDNGNTTSKNMCVMFFDMEDVDDTEEYESLVYVAYMINDCYYNA